MLLLNSFIDVITSYNARNKKLLLAVSGGIDSVVLCELSKQAGLYFAIAHCNFGLRGEESERDELFVRNLAKRYEVDVFVKKFDTQADAAVAKMSIQEAARNLRYDWFEELRNEHHFTCTLLAHHANDNIETLLMNFFRGSGLDGLTGMPEQKAEANCLRPLLQIKRSDIETFAKENKLAWVEDSTNSDAKYTRNFFRNDLLPQLKKVYPQVEENLLHNISRLEQTNTLYKQLLAQLKQKLFLLKGNEVHVSVLQLMKYKNTSLLYEVLSGYGFGEGFVPELIKLADAESGRYISNNTYRIIKNRKWFIIAPLAVNDAHVIIDREDELVLFGAAQLRLKMQAATTISIDRSGTTAQLDAATIDFPLLLRKWKAGDYFYPLGLRKKKKLSRFFIDAKLSKTEKEAAWVIESHSRIVWVVGHRIDDRFKITPATRQVLTITQQR